MCACELAAWQMNCSSRSRVGSSSRQQSCTKGNATKPHQSRIKGLTMAAPPKGGGWGPGRGLGARPAPWPRATWLLAAVCFKDAPRARAPPHGVVGGVGANRRCLLAVQISPFLRYFCPYPSPLPSARCRNTRHACSPPPFPILSCFSTLLWTYHTHLYRPILPITSLDLVPTFRYLRYTATPDVIWQWFIDYIDDPAPIRTRLAKTAPETTMGQFLRGILRDCKYAPATSPAPAD